MSFFARLKAIFGAKANQALDQIEDPRASLDYSLMRLQASLRQISDSLVEVSTARHTLEAQRGQAQKAVDQTEEQARQAVSLNREDLATRALERKAAAQERLNSLNSSRHRSRSSAVNDDIGRIFIGIGLFSLTSEEKK